MTYTKATRSMVNAQTVNRAIDCGFKFKQVFYLLVGDYPCRKYANVLGGMVEDGILGGSTFAALVMLKLKQSKGK